jgi:hypothetical protein
MAPIRKPVVPGSRYGRVTDVSPEQVGHLLRLCHGEMVAGFQGLRLGQREDGEPPRRDR